MAEEIVIGVAANAVESLISRTWQEIQCLLNYNTNIKKLKEKVEYLEVRKHTVQLSVDEATNNAEVIAPDVQHWLEKVDNIKQEVNKFLEHTRNTQWGCLYCKCPKPHSRYKLSKQASEWTTEVIGLHDSSKFERIGYPAQPGQMPFTSPVEFDGFESRIKIIKDVMKALRDDSIRIIGICGMAGIGKTTLVKEIADKVKAANLFDEVAMAVVSNDAVVANVQDQLAECLGMNIEEKTDRGRAERLHKRLMNKDKRILVILDDLWEKIDLHDIGIPINGEGGGLKVLLTSRFLGVCRDDMKAKTTFEVKVLSEEESWHLFKKSAEISEEANEIKDIAKQVAKECKQLPLAIVIVGSALKNKEDYAWRDALRELKESSGSNFPGMEKFVFSRIKLSYNYLKDDSKFLLLLCSLFPEDFQIALEDLVRYAKGMQSSYLFKDVKTISQVRDRVCMITDDLKSCYLLLEGDAEKYVKLHDVVRDACLTIDFTGEQLHTVKHDGLKEWPQEDSCASSTAISLTFGEINQPFSSLEEYPKLELLLLKFQGHTLDMHEEFFRRMKEMKVLHLWKLNIEQIPSSLQSLVNLRTLCLDYCRLYGDLSMVIESQKKLEILSFYSSYLEHFPDNISELSNLKSLDLRFKEGPPLPSGILVRLEKLEELYLGSTLKGWEREGEEAYSVIITEISSLLNLQTIECCAYDSCCLEQVLEKLCHPEKLMRFKITKSSYSQSVQEYQFGKVLNLKDINVDLLKKNASQCFLQKTEDLTLKEVKGKELTNLVSELDGKGFVNLKTLNLEGCCDLRYLVDATSSNKSSFINLEKLRIVLAENLEELWHGNIPLGSFARLRKLNLYALPALRSFGLMRSLLQLQQIQIYKCHKLETIVSNNKEGENNHVEFPKLTYLYLNYLDSFRSFVPESTSGALLEKIFLPSLKYLEIMGINGIRCLVDGQMTFGSLSNLHTIMIDGCDGLVHVTASADSVKLLHNLRQLECYSCKSMEVVFDFKDLTYEELQSFGSPLARLESLALQYLPKLKHIWRMLPEEIHAFKNLTSLVVYGCGSFKYLLSPSMAKMLAGLEILRLRACDQMKAIIGVDEREIMEIQSQEYMAVKKEGNENTSKLEFPKLKRIEVESLPNFRMLCSENVELKLPLLTELVIWNCPNMTKFCDATSLNNVKVKFKVDGSNVINEKEIVLDEFSSWLKDCESRIRCIECSFYEIESCNHLD